MNSHADFEFPDDPRPRRDETLAAWVVSRHADVVAALEHPGLSAGDEPDSIGGRDARIAVRNAARRSLSADRLVGWRSEMERSARERFAAIHPGERVDLVTAVAEPWSESLAMLAAGARSADRAILTSLARRVFADAAVAVSADSTDDGRAAAADLAIVLAHQPGRDGAASGVQAFVALSQTLPRLLASAWLALGEHPVEYERLRANRALLPRAVEELLRFAGPSRAVFRQARTNLDIGGAAIAAGESVAVLLSIANRDPEKFTQPDVLDLERDASGHVAFGRGSHSCVGAQVVRLALDVATSALIDAADHIEIAGRIEWTGGFAIRGPSTLPVALIR